MTKVLFKTNMGDFTVQLDDDLVPNTCQNFLDYVNDGFYDNTIFHRVIKHFVVQGGGFDPHMQQQVTRDAVMNEAHLGRSNARGTLAMARTSDPHSATSQFFINLRDNGALDFRHQDSQGWGYCVFGQVMSGMEVIDKIARLETGDEQGHSDVPLEPVIISQAISL